MKLAHKYIFLFCLLTLFGCDYSVDTALCGEPEGKQKTFIDSVNKLYKGQLIISHVPCYGDYIRVNQITDYRKTLIDSLENSYEHKVNWAEFHVYNKDGKLIRGYTGSM